MSFMDVMLFMISLKSHDPNITIFGTKYIEFPTTLCVIELLQHIHIQTHDILPLLSLSCPHNIDLLVFLYYFDH